MISIKSVIGFSAEWCPQCPRMYPVWDALGGDGYEVTLIDVDERREIAKEYGVMSLPCTIILEDGKEVDRIIGARPRSFMLDKLK